MKNSKNIIFIALCGISLLVGVVCFSKTLVGYAILAFTVSVIFGFFAANDFLGNRNPNQAYENKVKDLLNTYDSILLKCNSVPNV